MATLTPPKNLKELIAFLEANPKVVRRVEGGGLGPEGGDRMTFKGFRGGGLWFDTDEGKEAYLPINCGMTPAETGVTFRADGFDVTKFGVTFRYDYAGEPGAGGGPKPVAIENATVRFDPGPTAGPALTGQALRNAVRAALEPLAPPGEFFLAVVSENGQRGAHVLSNLDGDGMRACLADALARMDEEDADADGG